MIKSVIKKPKTKCALVFVASTLLFAQIVNYDVRHTADNLCRSNDTYKKNSSLCLPNVYREAEFGFSINPIHFFLSDFAFRHIFTYLGHSNGSSLTLFGGGDSTDWQLCGGISDNPTCYKDTEAINHAIRNLNKRIFIVFIASFTLAVLLTRKFFFSKRREGR